MTLPSDSPGTELKMKLIYALFRATRLQKKKTLEMFCSTAAFISEFVCVIVYFLCFKPVVPNLFCAMDRFHIRQYFHGPGGISGIS